MAWAIKDWDKYFEKSDTRKCGAMRWIALPNKHDGKSYRRIMRQDDAAELFTAWILLLQVSSKMPVRGVLSDEDGALTAEDLSDKTGFPKIKFEKALDYLSSREIAWLVEIQTENANLPVSPDVSGQHPEVSRLQDITIHNSNTSSLRSEDAPSVDTLAAKSAPTKKPRQSREDYIAMVYAWKNRVPLQKYEQAYPGMAIHPELNRAVMWLENNPQNRKKKFDDFFARWLSKNMKRKEPFNGTNGYRSNQSAAERKDAEFSDWNASKGFGQ